MNLEAKCSCCHCGGRIAFPREMAGQAIACPHCQLEILLCIPSDSDLPPTFATDKQKEKLHFFGCTWDEGITAGQASDALVECARQFPDREAAWQIEKRKSKIHRERHSKEVTIQKAETEANQSAARREDFYPAPRTSEQFDEIRSFGKEPPDGLTFKQAKVWIKHLTEERSKQVTIKKQPDAVLPTPSCKKFWHPPDGNLTPSIYLQYPPEPQLSDAKYQAWDSPEGREYGLARDRMHWAETVKKIEAENQYRYKESLKPQSPRENIQEAVKPQNPSPREYAIPARVVQDDPSSRLLKHQYTPNGFCKNCGWERSFIERNQRACLATEQRDRSQEVTIQEAVKPQNVTEQTFTIPARVVQEFTQEQEPARKPAVAILTTTIKRFAKRLDGLLGRNQTWVGGQWLPVGPLDNVEIAFSRQIADSIEAKGYCVEPDARFKTGLYGYNQTLALFKPFDGDPIHPSKAYLGAANLLRLCVLIATADGRIDLIELNLFRQAIENQIGLSQTDHKRLLVLEQLLAQELCSASKAVVRIAKSVPTEKRLVIGKLLVEIAAANNFITDGERRVLERIFNAFEIPPETLEKLIGEICPCPRRDVIQDDISKDQKWHWNHWRTGHPGDVIDDFTLAEKRWNFNDWKALNARWRALHERLVARQKQSSTARGGSFQETRTAARSNSVRQEGFFPWDNKVQNSRTDTRDQRIPEPVAATLPTGFSIDMSRVSAIVNETKEVVRILSILMEDEPEKTIALPKTVAVPLQEIQKVSSDGKTAPQPARFNGLDVAFHPILERLLARDSWSQTDFNSLAREFHFMPLDIHDTLNEWADEVLGEFLLDGDNPVVIRRELIAKETILYG